MKKVILAAAALAASIGSAFAADLPSRKAAPVYVPPPPPLWTGFYVGLNAGGAWSDNNGVNASAGPVAPGFDWGILSALSGTVANGSTGGFLGGGQVGYNYQFGSGLGGFGNSWVVGIEADIQGFAGGGGSNTSSSASIDTINPTFAVIAGTTISRSLDYLGTVRGRIGLLVTPTLLLYGTGGLAYGGTNLNASAFAAYLPIAGGPVGAVGFGGASYSDTSVGWTAGGGVEWLFLPNWSAKVEYLYFDLGSATLTSVVPTTLTPTGVFAPTLSAGTSYSSRFSGNIVRAGVNYHFNWAAPAPVAAKF